jgi:hypothetical protein
MLVYQAHNTCHHGWICIIPNEDVRDRCIAIKGPISESCERGQISLLTDPPDNRLKKQAKAMLGRYFNSLHVIVNFPFSAYPM